MTNYWDDWAQILYRWRKNEIDIEMFDIAITNLIEELHSYEHEHGGHVLDIYLENKKFLNEIKKKLLRGE